MAAITAAQVKALREETGLPMMECKSALVEADGNAQEAKDLLQRKYKGKMEKRAGNVTGEGRVAIAVADDRKSGAIIDVRCESAPVAKTDRFIQLADNIARAVLAQGEVSPSLQSALGLQLVGQNRTVEDDITDTFGLIRENIKLEGVRKVCGGFVCGYVHHDAKTGVLVALDAVPNPESVAIDLCHHVTFTNPMAIHREQIPEPEITKMRSLAREIAESEGKPAQVIEKIVEGKVNAFCAENALMDQEHVKVPKTKVRDVLRGGGVNDVLDIAFLKIGA